MVLMVKKLTLNKNLTLDGVSEKVLTLNNSLAFGGTDSTVMTFPTTSATLARTDAGNYFFRPSGNRGCYFNRRYGDWKVCI